MAVVVSLTVSGIDGGVARAAGVSEGRALTHRVQVSAEAKRTSIIRRAVNSAGCQAVATGAAVQADLSEATPVATAAMVISASGTYQKLNVDATGCDIGIYVEPTAKNVKIEDVAVHGATRAGIVVDSAQCSTLLADTIYKQGRSSAEWGSVRSPS